MAGRTCGPVASALLERERGGRRAVDAARHGDTDAGRARRLDDVEAVHTPLPNPPPQGRGIAFGSRIELGTAPRLAAPMEGNKCSTLDSVSFQLRFLCLSRDGDLEDVPRKGEFVDLAKCDSPAWTTWTSPSARHHSSPRGYSSSCRQGS